MSIKYFLEEDDVIFADDWEVISIDFIDWGSFLFFCRTGRYPE